MGLTAAPMTDGAVRELSRWRYDGEYAVYDESPYEEKRAKGSPLLDPDHRGRYTCFYDGDTLMGYINLARMEGAVHFGIALAPDYCGRGHGKGEMAQPAPAAGGAYLECPGHPML